MPLPCAQDADLPLNQSPNELHACAIKEARQDWAALKVANVNLSVSLECAALYAEPTLCAHWG